MMWKPLPRHVLKTLRGSLKGKAQREQYLLAVGLSCYIKCGISSVGEENEILFIIVWKPLLSRRVLKTLRGSLEGKTQRGQYLLAVGLSCYIKCGIFSVGEENKIFFIKVWKPFPSRRVLKTSRGSLKGKAQRKQYLLAVLHNMWNI